MESKEFRISAAGLKNIIFTNSFNDDDFVFIIGNHEIRMKKIFADFISPRVSQIHQVDPTIDSFSINEYINEGQKDKISDIFPTKILTKFEEISRGNKVEIDSETSNSLRNLSIILDNSEIFDGMIELFPIEINQTTIDTIIQYLQLFDMNKTTFSTFEPTKFYDIIASNLHSIEEEKLFQFPKTVMYSIINNEHLKVKSEDSLLDFINHFFVEEKNELIRISLYERVHIKNLSKEKLNEFLDHIKASEITSILWGNLKDFICKNNMYCSNQNFNNVVKVPYENDKFRGIITKLGEGDAKNAFKKGAINITANSNAGDSYLPYKSLEYNSSNYYHSYDNSNYEKEGHTEWLCVDFKERKVKPSHYSLKSYASGSDYNLKNWVLEGSNDGNSWTVLDTKNEDKSLNGSDVSNTFEIPNNNQNNEFYRYLRIRQTGPNTTNGDYRFIIKSIEYFGSIAEI